MTEDEKIIEAFEKQRSYSYKDTSFVNFKNGYLAGKRSQEKEFHLLLQHMAWACDNLNDLPISDKWAATWVNGAEKYLSKEFVNKMIQNNA